MDPYISSVDGYDPNGYGIDPMSGDTVGNDPTLGLESDPFSGDTLGNIPAAGYYPDPGAQSGGSVTVSNGGTAAAGGGSGFGTFLTSLGSFAGGLLRGSGVVGGVQPPLNGRTVTGVPCALGSAGCTTAAASTQTTMMVLVGVGAIVLVIMLRGR